MSVLQPYSTLVKFSSYLAYIVIMVAVAVIVGWQFDIDIFKRIIPGLVAMNPLTSLCFILSSISLLLYSSSRQTNHSKARIVALMVTILCLVKIVGLLLGFENNIDNFLFRHKLQADIVENNINSMAPNTGICFILISIALVFIPFETKKGKRISEHLAIAVLLLSLLSIIGYIYGVSFYYRILAFIPMALHTALCFLFISIAVLFLYPNKGMMAELTTQHAGGKMARKLLLPIILIPVLLGWISLIGKHKLFFDTEFAAATFTIGVIILLAAVAWQAIKSLNKADRQRDINESELRNANEELRTQAEKLESLNGELESFSYSISHDLRAPLRSIAGFGKILEEDYGKQLDQNGKKVLNTILSSTEKMNKLIDCLLNFSKLERENIEKTKINMKNLAEKTLEDLLDTRAKEFSIAIDKLPSAYADQLMMTLVYQNLISNAIKYSSKKESPSIHIGATEGNDEVIYFVKDNGAGFDMNFYDKLFGVFQRLHSEREFEGTGIGLATVNKIIQRHGGRIWAEGKVDEGSAFYFTVGK